MFRPDIFNRFTDSNNLHVSLLSNQINVEESDLLEIVESDYRAKHDRE